jgi:hypothetical protein
MVLADVGGSPRQADRMHFQGGYSAADGPDLVMEMLKEDGIL